MRLSMHSLLSCFAAIHKTPTASRSVGLFLGPQMVGEALKGGRLVASVMAAEGFDVVPSPAPVATHAFITAVQLGTRERMLSFCRAVQRCSPVGSYIQPEPGALPAFSTGCCCVC